MISRRCLVLGVAVCATVAHAGPGLAQDTSLPACESQQEMEQVIQSDGDLMPDGCRSLTITSIESDVGELCVLDFESADPGVLETLQDAAMPTQWWVRCDELSAP